MEITAERTKGREKRGSKGEWLIDFGVELVVETGKRREERRLQEP